ncbi:MAG: RdgB/HAM1 family non-canonical purine NTP pyrophosphatase [Salinivirgaceae bacterium]|jgi:XTP/dITP diphosphohydrolase|nr:RdgB/HAM1 family non-canonical purine NTP pyrophosphatase [Salinivirgaceae bacterium]
MKQIIFATQNRHKAKEVQKMTVGVAQIITLDELGYNADIEETGGTLEENALIKAEAIYKHYNRPVFADDTGLEVDALNGAPGVHSARFAGEPKSDKANLQKLIDDMEVQDNRTARFRTVICYYSESKALYFEGIVDGEIIKNPVGIEGFGYDPVFLPNGYSQTFAQMDMELKNRISHRGRAFRQFVAYLKKQM